MGKTKKTPKESMKYWCVGPKKLKIRARTARAAARKYLRGSAIHDYITNEYSCELFASQYDTVDKILKKYGKKKNFDISKVRVEPWDKIERSE